MRRGLENELMAWKQRAERLPILLRGARSVGKSTLIENFGRDHFEQVLSVNFEEHPELKKCFESAEPLEIVKRLELHFQTKIISGCTLLFLDEIQDCPEAFSSLRQFKDFLPELHLIAASSYRDLVRESERLKFPLSGLEFFYLRPLSFQEFLHLVSPLAAEKLSHNDCKTGLMKGDHEELLTWVRTYLFVGGMPSAVSVYLSTRSLLDVQKEHRKILQTYETALRKSASRLQQKHLDTLLDNIPKLIGKVLKYVQIAPEIRSRSLKATLSLLVNAGLIHQAFASLANALPLHLEMSDQRFKLFFLDVGLLQTVCQVNSQHLLSQSIFRIQEGMLAEQFAAQELLSYEPMKQNRPLFYWERGSGKMAEVDLVHGVGERVVAIEVKRGKTGTLRALKSFMHLKQSQLAVRISEEPVQLHDQILSVPFYLLSKLRECISCNM
ncbi:MAG: AAA family ATPase [Rhabdochlamydiaceae bacterium]|nr:AAA family ATPase [Rhabdochlamydiaceae bacterium]